MAFAMPADLCKRVLMCNKNLAEQYQFGIEYGFVTISYVGEKIIFLMIPFYRSLINAHNQEISVNVGVLSSLPATARFTTEKIE
jgi:hypothetical protein